MKFIHTRITAIRQFFSSLIIRRKIKPCSFSTHYGIRKLYQSISSKWKLMTPHKVNRFAFDIMIQLFIYLFIKKTVNFLKNVASFYFSYCCCCCFCCCKTAFLFASIWKSWIENCYLMNWFVMVVCEWCSVHMCFYNVRSIPLFSIIVICMQSTWL